jgi:hypothetical protein
VPAGLADLLDVERAHALLHAGRAVVRRLSCPRKYGLNGTMPALTNSRFGSSSSSDADGTTVWSRLSKNRRNRRRTSAVSIRGALLGSSGRVAALATGS